MKNVITVLPLGTKVYLGDRTDEFTGTITGINIVNNGDVIYKVQWWSGKTLSSALFVRNEFRCESVADFKIGFSTEA